MTCGSIYRCVWAGGGSEVVGPGTEPLAARAPDDGRRRFSGAYRTFIVDRRRPIALIGVGVTRGAVGCRFFAGACQACLLGTVRPLVEPLLQRRYR